MSSVSVRAYLDITSGSLAGPPELGMLSMQLEAALAESDSGFQAQLHPVNLGPAASGILYHSLSCVRKEGRSKKCVLGDDAWE